MVKTFEPDDPLDAFDILFGEVRRGNVKSGEIVRVWNQPLLVMELRNRIKDILGRED